MFDINTGESGSLGPWVTWTSNGSAQKGFKPKTWVLRSKDDNGAKTEAPVPAFENGCVMDLDSLKLGWEKDGAQGMAPERRWAPTLDLTAFPRPDDSKKAGGGYAWSKALSVRLAIGGGQAATWEQGAFAAFSGFERVANQVRAQWAEKSQNGRLLPLIKQSGVETRTLPNGSANIPQMDVVDWVERPDCLKADAPGIDTGTGAAEQPAQQAAPPAQQPAGTEGVPADSTF